MKYHFDKSLGKITQQISKALGKRFEEKNKKAGFLIKAEHWTVISMLHFRGTSSQKEISNTLFMDKVSVTRIAEYLEKSGFLMRENSSEDKRVNLVSLTDKGERLYDQLEKIAEATISGALKGFTETEQNQVFILLEKIRRNLID